jgi:hypothetical protein
MTQENDLVLVYFEDQPLFYARIEDISADVKKDWYHVKLLVLQVPLQVVTWILRDVYINGDEFTMNGKRMRLERVESPEETEPVEELEEPAENDAKSKNTNDTKVISLSDVKKK